MKKLKLIKNSDIFCKNCVSSEFWTLYSFQLVKSLTFSWWYFLRFISLIIAANKLFNFRLVIEHHPCIFNHFAWVDNRNVDENSFPEAKGAHWNDHIVGAVSWSNTAKVLENEEGNGAQYGNHQYNNNREQASKAPNIANENHDYDYAERDS